MSVRSLVKESLKLRVFSLGEAKQAQDGHCTYVTEHTAQGNELSGSRTSENYKENAERDLSGNRVTLR
jgi:hypothetical protein